MNIPMDKWVRQKLLGSFLNVFLAAAKFLLTELKWMPVVLLMASLIRSFPLTRSWAPSKPHWQLQDPAWTRLWPRQTRVLHPSLCFWVMWVTQATNTCDSSQAALWRLPISHWIDTWFITFFCWLYPMYRVIQLSSTDPRDFQTPNPGFRKRFLFQIFNKYMTEENVW